MGRKRKVRVEFKKNREKKARRNDLTREFAQDDPQSADNLSGSERVSGKGDISRYRTVIADEGDGDSEFQRTIDTEGCLPGRVIQAVGLHCIVEADADADSAAPPEADSESRHRYECTVRRVLRTMARDERNAVVAGDRVLFRPTSDEQAVIERVEPRRGVLSRHRARREHVLVANVDQVVIVVSAVDPPLKPHLIDRFLVSCEKGGVAPIICINKVDLLGEARDDVEVEAGDITGPDELQPLFGVYGRLGYDVVPVSAIHGWGVDRLRSLMRDRQSVVTGQSGVGKSSLLNAIEPGLAIKTGAVSDASSKGKHTTRRAELHELECGGWVADTPGIRQLELWNVTPEEVEAYFVEFRPLVAYCRFPDCTHTHEDDCGVQAGVDAGLVSGRRYDSYVRLITEEPAT